jgi:site-specific recombinase XerD
MEDLTSEEVLAFLQHVERERKITIGTRNCRLAAIRSFFRFVANHEPSAVAQCAGVLRLPTKKAWTAEVHFLNSEEITAILKQPDRSIIEGQRDHALLALLYNTGARIQEALDLSPRAVRFRSPAQVTLFGKGRNGRAFQRRSVRRHLPR